MGRDPAFLAKHAMTYPAEAVAAGLNKGKVIVLVGITPQGKVSEAIVECSSDPVFHTSALSEANSAIFVPAMKNGDAIPAVARIPFVFDNTSSLPHTPIMQENDKK